MRAELPALAWALLALVSAPPSATAAPDWRFGFEDTWSQLVPGPHNEGDPVLLGDKLELLTASQTSGGDVNFNQTAGGWGTMQAAPGELIDFSDADALVQKLQSNGFSMLWNLAPNSIWASEANADCFAEPVLTADPPILNADCAPDADHEDDLYSYVRAVVERYDGDGVDDMGGDTELPEDDLVHPVRFYLMTGEIEFAGANDAKQGYGDEALSPFWRDTLPHLLRTHRIVYQAIHDADPTGATKLVSSGGVLWDLYADFPDYPALDGPIVAARLAGANNHAVSYAESYQRLVDLLTGLVDESDGPKCDYIGWHPHMGWREIPQTFAFIHQHAPGKPIYVDDMWAQLFRMNREDAPGYSQFTDGGAAIAGDFPNALVANYDAIVNLMPLNFFGIRDWYYERGARQLVKSFVTAFGEGAERVSFSGASDFNFERFWLGGITGWLNLMGAHGDSLVNPYPEKPAYWTYKTLVETLHDFACVAELPVSSDPHTRVYRFERPRGPVWVGWSESAGAPPGLDYSIANGETVTFEVSKSSLLSTTIVDQVGETEPATAPLSSPGGSLTIQLGYRPLIVEWPDVLFADGFECGTLCVWSARAPESCGD